MKHVALHSGLGTLRRAAIIIPEVRRGEPVWRPRVLPAGSSVKMLGRLPSPVTGRCDELTVEWCDQLGRRRLGWLASTTPLMSTHRKIKTPVFNTIGDRDVTGAWDQIRDWIGHSIADEEPLRLDDWCRNFQARAFAKAHLPKLLAVVKDFGGTPRPTKLKDAFNLARRVYRLVTTKELPMAKRTAGEETSTKVSAKHRVKAKVNRREEAEEPKAKKAKEPGEGRSAARTVGNEVAQIVADGKLRFSNVSRTAISQMQSETTPSAKVLTTLRDDITAAAATARSNNKPKLAKRLSQVNRGVRRLARAQASA